jgi:hypothetical protein
MKEVSNLFKPKACDQTVSIVEDLLEKAKSGELKSLVFVDEYQDGSAGHGWAGTPSKKMIGELEEVKFCIFSQMYFPIMEED